jgi:hypothetical protein
VAAALVAVAAAAVAGVPRAAQGLRPPALEVVAGVPRPLQLAIDRRSLLVLGAGVSGDAAGELYRVDLDGARPLDLARQPRVRIPYPDANPTVLGSLALHPASHAVFLGEENGRRIYRLDVDGRLALYATGLRRLLGGSTLLVDGAGRLVVVDYADPLLQRDDEAELPGLDHLREEDYRGPLVFRLEVWPDVVLPRRVSRLAPLFPRGWGGRAGGGLLPRLVSAVDVGRGELVLLASSGELLRLAADGALAPFSRLPLGQYQRTNMAAAPDGTVYVSGGFWVASVYRVARDGTVSTIASRLADPQGIAVDVNGDVYLAESALHRVVRLPVR